MTKWSRAAAGYLGRSSPAWLSVLLGILCLWIIEASQSASPPPLTRRAELPATRLVVLLVDSLAQRDVETPSAMPHLAARLRRGGLHGPVEACADAVTVPCVAAAITASDRLSVFALGMNFASTGGLVENSVLGQLQREGVRAGYFGEPMLAKPMRGLHEVVADLHSDDELDGALQRALTRRDLQIVVAHLRELDQASHEHGASGPQYARVRTRVDERVEDMITRTLPTDHVLVMGDHGHTPSGRHAAGLDATTYAAYFGPLFSRSARVPMLITDHAALWAHIFGFSRMPPAWLDDYFAGAELRPGESNALAARPLPLWAATLVAALAALLGLASALRATPRERTRTLTAFTTSALVMATLGALWPTLRTFIWESGERIRLSSWLCALATGACGALLAGWLIPSRRDERPSERAKARLLAASVAFAIPTVYQMGGVHVAQGWLGAGLTAQAAWSAKRGDVRLGALSGVCGLLVFSLIPVKLANYVLTGFTVYKKHIPNLSEYALPVLAAAFLLAALGVGGIVRKKRVSGWLGLAGGVAWCACMEHVPSACFIVPCVLALPSTLLALSRPALAWLSVTLVLPAVWFLFDASLGQLVPLLAVWLLTALAPHVLREHGPALRGAALLVLVWTTFLATMACRISGIDFDFFVRFLPPGTDVTEHWLAQSALTAVKYLLAPTFGLLLARAHEPELGACVRAGVQLARGRLALCIYFLAGLCIAAPGTGAALKGDATQEVAFWVVLLATLGLASGMLPEAVHDAHP